MIRLPQRPEAPSRLRGRQAGTKRAALTRKFNRDGRISSRDFDPKFYSDLKIREPLWIWQGKKCCYCERRRDLKREPDVEHFRPKAMIEDETHPGYWWLAYEWTNLFFSCKTCNQEYKKCQFPLEPGGIRAIKPTDDLRLELPTLMDIGVDDPESLIGYYWEDSVVPLAKPIGRDHAGRGSKIIAILGLDRDELNEERGQLIPWLKKQVEAAHVAIATNNDVEIQRQRQKVRKLTTREQPFLGFRRFFFKQHDLDLDEFLAGF